MSEDEHCADGAHTQDCVTQQGVSLLPLQCLSIAPTVFLRHVSHASLFNLRARFCMILFYNHLTPISPRRLGLVYNFETNNTESCVSLMTLPNGNTQSWVNAEAVGVKTKSKFSPFV